MAVPSYTYQYHKWYKLVTRSELVNKFKIQDTNLTTEHQAGTFQEVTCALHLGYHRRGVSEHNPGCYFRGNTHVHFVTPNLLLDPLQIISP